MKFNQLGIILGLCVALGLSVPSEAAAVSAGEQASLQAAMQRHIDSALVEGRYLRLDADTGEVLALRPMAAHPVILRMGEYFVLCADFRAENGAKINIDFYLARKGRSFVVFDEQVDNRALIRQLMNSGKLARID